MTYEDVFNIDSITVRNPSTGKNEHIIPIGSKTCLHILEEVEEGEIVTIAYLSDTTNSAVYETFTYDEVKTLLEVIGPYLW